MQLPTETSRLNSKSVAPKSGGIRTKRPLSEKTRSKLELGNDSNATCSLLTHIYSFAKKFDPRFDTWTYDSWVLTGFVVLLMIAASTERVTFKMAVDDMTPYRYLLLLLTLLISTIAYSCIVFFKKESPVSLNLYSGPESNTHQYFLIKYLIYFRLTPNYSKISLIFNY
jgi:hypothetical protein